MIEKLAAAPDMVIFGASNSMWLGHNIFPYAKVLNNSVSDVTLADYLGIFEAYEKKKLYPKRMLLVLNPQLIIYPLTSEGWLSIKEDMFSMLNRLNSHPQKIQEPLFSQVWLNIFSFKYFQNNIKEDLRNGNARSMPFNKNNAPRQLFLNDGRRVWSYWILSLDSEQRRKKIIMQIQEGEFTRGLVMKPDKDLEGVLEKFIQHLMGRHIKVTLCLLPLHPLLYNSLLMTPNGGHGGMDVVGIEHYYVSLAKRLNLEIFGSYDPAACNLDGEDFYDDTHIRNDVLERVFKQKIMASPSH
jgi:hypothetical protein